MDSNQGLRSLRRPGYAYDDPALGGRDPQVAHMRDYVHLRRDDGGVHLNSGIPNHAFYRFAHALGGHAWDRVGHVWDDAVRAGLPPRCDFATFANATRTAARRHGAKTTAALRDAWAAVGVSVSPHARAAVDHDGAGGGVEYVGVRGHVITAAIAVLADGLPSTAEEICAQALARELVPAGTSKKLRLHRTHRVHRAHQGTRAQAGDRAGQLSAVPCESSAGPVAGVCDNGVRGRATAASLAALERVRTTATGLDPADFETAVCALFATLGFAATHMGGYDAPDGYLDAPLS